MTDRQITWVNAVIHLLTIVWIGACIYLIADRARTFTEELKLSRQQIREIHSKVVGTSPAVKE